MLPMFPDSNACDVVILYYGLYCDVLQFLILLFLLPFSRCFHIYDLFSFFLWRLLINNRLCLIETKSILLINNLREILIFVFKILILDSSLKLSQICWMKDIFLSKEHIISLSILVNQI